MATLVAVIILAGIAWLTPFTKKIILDKEAKRRIQKILNRELEKEIIKFDRDFLRSLEPGQDAERELEFKMKRLLDKKNWHILKNITLPRNDDKDKTTQIDLIALSVFGIFVIEVKDFTGRIYANNTPRWYRYPFKSRGDKLPFQNPHHQNYAHVMAVKQALKELKLDDKLFKSIVTFMGDAKYEGLPEFTYTNAISTLQALEAHKEKVISHEKLVMAIGLLEFRKKYDLPETSQSHIEHLKEKHKKTD